MFSKRSLGLLVMLLSVCLASTTASTNVPKPDVASKPASLKVDDGLKAGIVKPADAATKAKPMRAFQEPGPFKDCNACYRDQWGNNVRACCTTYWGDRWCYIE